MEAPVAEARRGRRPSPRSPKRPRRPFEAGKDQRKIKDDVDRDLLPIFLDEAKEIIPLVRRGRAPLEGARPPTTRPSAELQRHLHTLKGSARMAGLMRLGELAHVLEDARDRDRRRRRAAGASEFDEIEERVDRFSVRPRAPGARRGHLEAEPIEVPVAAVFEHQKDKPARDRGDGRRRAGSAPSATRCRRSCATRARRCCA